MLPSQPTPVERLVRWASITSVHPGTGHFDARRFVRDMVDRNMLFTLSLVRSSRSVTRMPHAQKTVFTLFTLSQVRSPRSVTRMLHGKGTVLTLFTLSLVRSISFTSAWSAPHGCLHC